MQRKFFRTLAGAACLFASAGMLFTAAGAAEAPAEQEISSEAEAPAEQEILSEAEMPAEKISEQETAMKDVFVKEALYLGVDGYGKEGVDKDHKNDFLFRFEIDGIEEKLKIWNGVLDEEGNYDYPIQNVLKEGYRYTLTIESDTVIAAEEILAEELSVAEADFTPVVQGEPGVKTVKNFLLTALEPVGTTLYIYGGGWDWQDVGSSVQARELGVSQDWVTFFRSQDENFTYKEKDGDEANADPENSYYPYGEYNEYYYAGLDCSGYVGWAVYNTMETENGEEGYVCGATGMAGGFAEKGWGTWTKEIEHYRPGDVMSIGGHVWISLGECSDGSIVIAHATPSRSRTNQPGGGVQISAVGESETCEAYALAEHYMETYYPEWFERYPIYLCSPETYKSVESEKAGLFSWGTEAEDAVVTDPEGITQMSPEQVLKELFGE